MIRHKGDIAIVTGKNPIPLDGYEPVRPGKYDVQKKIMQPCEYRAETYVPAACCGRMAEGMKMVYTCLVLDKIVKSSECKDCYEKG